jgi:hypothetical protein
MKKALLLFSIVIIGFFMFTGQNIDSPRWSQGPVLTPVISNTGNVRIPLLNDQVIFSTVPRYYHAPDGVQAINPSFRVHPSSVMDQAEVYLACGRFTNQNILYGSANSVNITSVGIFDGCYLSTNSGANWYGSDSTPCGNYNIQRGDVAPVVCKDGRLIITHLASATNFGGLTGMAAEYSTNFGVSFSTPFQISSATSVDKNLTGTDDSPTSPYYGNSYIAYVDYTSGTWTSYFSRTTNGGVSWSTPFGINSTPTGRYAQGHDVDAMTDGTVIVVWTSESSSSPYAAMGYGIARSTNGGANFLTANETAFTATGNRSASFNGWGIRTNDFPRISIDKSGGARNNWIYVVHPQITQAPAGTDQDVVLNKSTDGGVTWSTGVRVNQDALNNGKVQFFPAVNVDAGGGVNVIYYDNRFWANTGDSCTVFVSRSTDGGNTFTEYRICDHAFKPKGENGMSGGYMGDYIGITSGNNKIWGNWMDDITGKYQSWAASIELGPSISHTPLTNTEQTTGTRLVSCTINPAGSGINPGLTRLYYRIQPTTTWTQVQLTNSSGTTWQGNITMGGAGTYNYYLTTTDSLSRVATAPAGAPASYYSFIASPDTIKPVITHTPLGNQPKAAWPPTVSATVTDNIGVDSAWVKWYKNTPATLSREFKLNNTSGSNYSAAFNSTQAEVLVNDSIFYRVFAQDNSSNHNRDSSALIKFKIVQLTNACIGTGTTSSGYPFSTYWEDGRTDILYLASEISGSGLSPGSITTISFDVTSVGGPAMSGFNVRLQNTSMTSVTAFVNSGWSTCYSGTYTVSGTGWQPITLTTPFFWNGTNNLLIEVCYNNAAWTAYSNVNATTQTNMMVGYYTDLPTGDGCTAAWTATSPGYRANMCFNIIPLGEKNISSPIPTTYALKQNYPNPFNPVTKISYDIPKQGLVTMKIYDILGREVRQLVNEVKSPGSYSVDFNAADLSSGVYFYKLESMGYSDIKRMMLIK